MNEDANHGVSLLTTSTPQENIIEHHFILHPLSDETKKFHRDFFRDQNFQDRDFFSRPNIFETDTETFF